MSSLKRDDLGTLRKLLIELLDFIEGLCVEESPYFSRFIENMKNNLEICYFVQYDGWEQMEYLLKRDWSEANHRLIGIPGFDIHADNPEEKERLDCRFLELVSGIERYVKE